MASLTYLLSKPTLIPMFLNPMRIYISFQIKFITPKTKMPWRADGHSDIKKRTLEWSLPWWNNITGKITTTKTELWIIHFLLQSFLTHLPYVCGNVSVNYVFEKTLCYKLCKYTVFLCYESADERQDVHF